jgi:hypothetical protein
LLTINHVTTQVVVEEYVRHQIAARLPIEMVALIALTGWKPAPCHALVQRILLEAEESQAQEKALRFQEAMDRRMERRAGVQVKGRMPKDVLGGVKTKRSCRRKDRGTTV